MRPIIKRVALTALVLIVVGATAIFSVLMYQGKREVTGNPQYVALGSSFAAGLGLGDRASGSPFACQRSINGYPPRLARAAHLSLVDMSCSGSTVNQVLNGGQYFQGPQIAAVESTTQLVTLTAGGNDISYIGDLVAMGYRNRGGIIGQIVGWTMHVPHSPGERNVAKVKSDIKAAILAVRRRAPSAVIVVATYPPVLPEQGTCTALNLTDQQAALMRPVATQLVEATREAARASGALLADMSMLGNGHDACSSTPWTNGLAPATGAPFHPTQAGAEATAREIARIASLKLH